MNDSSQHSFKLCEMADDLLDYTLKVCGKNTDIGKKRKTYRFPLYLYPNYVTYIIESASKIHKNIIIANESRDLNKRIKLQEETLGICIYLNHLTRLARDNGWISEKQLEKWNSLTNSIYWKTFNWQKSDKKRL